MSFKTNDVQQISFTDSFYQLTAREQRALENSWAKVFSEEIFPNIDEKPFAVLYSQNASRPNTPINVLVGADIIKQLFDYSDDEMVENLMLDIRMQYALHTTSFEEQPLSDKSLSRFRRKCYDYETLTGKDLFHDCISKLSNKIAHLMELDGHIRRMDSMMIDSNMRKLARIELIYTCIAKLAKYVRKNTPDALPEQLLHYTEDNDYNRVLYHQRNTEIFNKMDVLLEDADTLYKICQSGYEDVTEYELFIRCFSEQTILDQGKRRFRTKGDPYNFSKNLLNPTDPEATFRTKGGKSYKGYVANLEESVGSGGSVVTDYDYDQNVHSDIAFLKERLEELPSQEKEMVMVTDGAYYSNSVKEAAKKKNINLVVTALTGAEPAEILSKYKLDEEKRKIIACPAGYQPKSQSYKPSNDEFKLSFDKDQCASCPYRSQCRAKIYKRVAKVLVTRKSFIRSDLMQEIKSEAFKCYSHFRNGVETLPSILRRNYRLDKLPTGKQRGKYFFGCKIGALNFKKLFNYRKGLGNYAPNPLLT